MCCTNTRCIPKIRLPGNIPTLFILVLLIVLLTRGNKSLAQANADYADSLAMKLQPTRKLLYKKLGDTLLFLHVFEPKGHHANDKVPCFISIHGGGWSGSGPRRMYPIVAEFARLGMVGISVQYRLIRKGSPVTVFDCDKDGRSAVRFIRKYAKDLGIDPDKIILSGGSAGGQIAAGTELFEGVDDPADDLGISCKPNALILFYPVIDTSPEGYGNKDIGKGWIEISPLHQVRSGVCPTLIFHGTADVVTPYKGAKAFYEAMQKNENICVLHTNLGMGHTYLMIDKKHFDEAMLKTRSFLQDLNLLKPDTIVWQGKPGQKK